VTAVDFIDNPAARIESLHDRAEELAAEAKHHDEPRASAMRAQARALVRQAARIRERYEEEL
jgi:hypothetical protein